MERLQILVVGHEHLEDGLIRELNQRCISACKVISIADFPKIKIGDAAVVAIGMIEKENMLEKIDFGLLNMLSTPQPEFVHEPFSSTKFPKNKTKLVIPKDISRKLPFKKRYGGAK